MARAITAAAVALTIAQGLATLGRGERLSAFLPLELAGGHGVTPALIEKRQDSGGLRAALAELRRHATTRYGEFRGAAPTLLEAIVPAVLTASLTPLWLAGLEGTRDPLAPVRVPRWRRQWTLWRAWRRWPAI